MITRLALVVIEQAYCETCGTLLGRNIAVIDDQAKPELLCKDCRRPRQVGADGIGRPVGRENAIVRRKNTLALL